VKTILSNIEELLRAIFSGSKSPSPLDAINARLDHMDAKLDLLSAYLGLTPPGASPADLDALGARIAATKAQIAQFDQSVTGVTGAPPA